MRLESARLERLVGALLSLLIAACGAAHSGPRARDAAPGRSGSPAEANLPAGPPRSQTAPELAPREAGPSAPPQGRPRSGEAAPANDGIGHDAAHPNPLGEPCGALDCRRFDDPVTAFQYVIADTPLLLGVGEAHVLAAAGDVRSAARRFAEDLLPALGGERASHLIVEILNPNPSCRATTEQVEKRHEPVTQAQSRSNQNDYENLGHQARRLGIEPFLLSPTCEEYARIASAGADAIPETLATIADVTSRMAVAALRKNARSGRERIVIAYGGALHNDVKPDAARARFSYGPRLIAATEGRYTALDLIVRELIKDNSAWRAQAWFDHFDPALHESSTIVMRTAPQSYVLFFPKAASTAAAP